MPKKTDLEVFADRLNQYLRDSRDALSDAALARELSLRSGIGLSGQAIWNWKHAKNWPKVPHLKALAEYLRIDPAELMFGDNNGKGVKDGPAQYNALTLQDRHAIDRYAALTAPKRRAIRELIDQLSGS